MPMPLFSTFGQLPNTWITLLLIILSGLSEGVGLTLFIPLLHIITGEDLSTLQMPFSLIVKVFEAAGILPKPLILIVCITVFTLGSLAVGYQQIKMMIKGKHQFSRQLRNRFFSGILRAEWGYSSRRPHGNIINQLTVECTRAGNALEHELMVVATSILIGLYIIFSITISWQLMVMAFIFGLLVFIVIRPFSRRSRTLGERIKEANQNLGFYSVEYLRSLKLLKSTATEPFAEDDMAVRNGDVFTTFYKSGLNTTRVYFLTQALPVLMLVTIIGVSYEVLGTSPPLILVFLMFMARMAPRVAQLQQNLQNYHNTSPSLRTIYEQIEESAAAQEDLNAQGKLFDHIDKTISLEALSFKFSEGDMPAINDVNIIIPRNKMVAIVGGSGAGKSTVMDILTGLRRPSSGRVAIDGINLSDFNLSSWRKRLGIVTQEPIIFNSSLRENLIFFNLGIDDKDIELALSSAHLDEVVASLPEGLDTVLGEGGVRLSGGQKQRVALARALIDPPELLLLDEATSALDNESERLVQEAIESIAHTMTIVVIAHRLSTVRRADLIYVMEKGRVVETGTYDELLNKGGRFSDLHGMEFS